MKTKRCQRNGDVKVHEHVRRRIEYIGNCILFSIDKTIKMYVLTGLASMGYRIHTCE